jgi:hypothetical protein
MEKYHMANDYLPSSDEGLLTWVLPFSAKITAGPVPFGVTAAIATALAGKVSAYQDALAAATDPATRGGSTINAKNIAKDDLIEYVRQVARQIQGTMTVTDEQRYDLGLTVRDAEPSPVPPPAHAPQVVIENVNGRVVSFRLIDPENPTRRSKPAGVAGANVFSFVGENAPEDINDWVFEGNNTRTILDVTFPNTVALGAKVWITAAWYNPRGEAGPGCPPVSAHIQFGGALAA